MDNKIQEAFSFLANKIYKNGETKTNCEMCLIPSGFECCIHNNKRELTDEEKRLVDVSTFLYDKFHATHYRLKWESIEDKTVKITLQKHDGFGAGKFQEVVHEETIQV